MKYINQEPWQQWEKRDIDGALVDRARGVLPEMECTKQLVELVARIYRPGMRVLDVGCNAGHYYRALRRIDANMAYHGFDINPRSIANAREIFGGEANARFDVHDIREALPEGGVADITFCCNVLLHLPDFRAPLRNLLGGTREVCIVRTLLDVRTTLSQRVMSHDFPEDQPPTDYYNMNTWSVDFFTKYAADLGWRAELIEDRFRPEVLQGEYSSVKGKDGTRIVGSMQADGAVLYNWMWAVFTRGTNG